MSTGVAIVVAGGALLAVLYVTRRQEQLTAMRANNIKNSISGRGLTGGDVAAGIAAGVATYYGGPKAGQATLSAFGKHV